MTYPYKRQTPVPSEKQTAFRNRVAKELGETLLLLDGITPKEPSLRAYQISNDLMRLTAKYLQLQMDQCNEADLIERAKEEEGKVEAAILKIIRPLGAGWGVVFEGDPRGATVKLKVPSGYTDDWAHEGLCVPVGEV